MKKEVFMHNSLKATFLGSLIIAANASHARTIEEILAISTDPAIQGREIAIEADNRDFGFNDSEVTLKMILRNAQGEESTRELRTKTFEMTDKSVGDKSLTIFDTPRDVEGTAFLTHSKILDPDDQWIFLPELGRVKRISSRNKSGPFMGSEFAYEDMSSQEVDKYTYTYLRQEACPTNTALNCAVIEFTPAYKHSGYTKQIGWIDTAEFRQKKVEFYDRKKELLKTLTNENFKQYLNKHWRPHSLKMVNHQTGKSTDLMFTDYTFKQGLRENEFVRSRLKNAR